jgi:trehalose 6-phosphate synthase/phosphatase
MPEAPNNSPQSSGRLVIVSNRLPVSVERQEDGFAYHPSVGGLATSLDAIRGKTEMLWLGWPGLTDLDAEEEQELEHTLSESYNCLPLFIPEDEFGPFYTGFSNGCLWPLFHYFPQYAHYDWDEWNAYESVNRRFRDRLLDILRPDDRVWIHDYHLMRLPALVRKDYPEANLGFFLHIPFPSYEIFRMLPWRNEILHGLMGADLIGFHSFSYARHFLSSVLRLLGLEQEFGRVVYGERPVRIETFPLGVDVERFAKAHEQPEIQTELADLRRQADDRRIILSVDRLDFTKGILQRLDAFEEFLERYPQWQSKVSLISLCVPSRTSVPEYQQLKRQVDEMVGKINGRYSEPGWTPIWYLYRMLPFNNLVSLYLLADVALVTPLRDGMNLVAKEYLAARSDETGVLILSETAGSAEELGEALIVNPHDSRSIVEHLLMALEMPDEEQKRRNRPMIARLKRYTVDRWAEDFLTQLEAARRDRPSYRVHRLADARRKLLLDAFETGKQRLLLLDYDGTLVGFTGRAEGAEPDAGLLELLAGLAAEPANKVVVISGRDHATLQRWVGETGVDMVAEHGARLWNGSQGEWQVLGESFEEEWQQQIRPVLEVYVDRTPGAYVEDKGSSLVWHYRRAEPELGSLRAKELMENLESYLANTPLHVMQGNKVVEIKQSNINKGRAALRLLQVDPPFDFVMAVGDDVTDEDVFESLPAEAWTIKVGRSAQTYARFYLPDSWAVRDLLEDLLDPDESG